MQTILAESFPNREFRITITRELLGRDPFLCPDDEESPPKPKRPRSLDIRSKLETPLQERVSASLVKGLKTGFGLLPRMKRFSLRARRMLVRAGGALEATVDHKKCLFITCTLPGSTNEAFKSMAAWSGYAIHRLKAWIAKRVQSKYDMYVWEWQKRGALHLHYVVYVEDDAIAKWIDKQLQSEWIRILDSICELSGVDVYKKNEGFTHAGRKQSVQVRCERVKKSVAAYLAKYFSKGGDPGKSGRARLFAPSAWYGISRPLRSKLQDYTNSERVRFLPNRAAWRDYEECLHVLATMGFKCEEFSHKAGSGKTIVAYVSKEVREQTWELLMNTLKPTIDSCSTGDGAVYRLLRMASYLMKQNSRWSHNYSSNSYPYVGMLVSKFNASERMTSLEAVSLLDYLLWNLSLAIRAGYVMTGQEALLLSSLRELMHRESELSVLRCYLCHLQKPSHEELTAPPSEQHIGTKPPEAPDAVQAVNEACKQLVLV